MNGESSERRDDWAPEAKGSGGIGDHAVATVNVLLKLDKQMEKTPERGTSCSRPLHDTNLPAVRTFLRR